jgi:aminoglycoside/choline kinase family phosphotransferase
VLVDDGIDAATLEQEKLASIVRAEIRRPPDAIEPIAAGLGSRRFYRIRFEQGEPRTLIARVETQTDGNSVTLPTEPSDWLPEPPLEPLRSFLEGAGLPVPRSYAHLPQYGLDLLEDVGNRTLADADASAQDDLYREACELVPRLQRLCARPEEIPAFGRIFDPALVATKAWKWLHWAIPGLLEREPEPEETVAVEAAFSRISELLEDAPRRLAHRDFKAENLHLVGEIEGGAASAERLVMIDVQGAFVAPPEYDLVCLLYDLQAEIDEDFAQESFRAVLPMLPDAPDLSTAELRFDAIATIRLCKDVSHLVHAARARNDVRRWHEIPRGLMLLERATGRLGHTFPEVRALTSVIRALTAAVGSSDSTFQEPARR